MKSSSVYQVISILLTFIFAFLVAANFGTYHKPEEANLMKKQLLSELEKKSGELNSTDPGLEFFRSFQSSIELSLTPQNYKMHSLYRIIGCFISLLGIVMLRRKKALGLHLVIAGIIFVVFTGFYVFGFTLIGWVFNILYILFGGLVSLYYYSKRELYA